MGNLLPILENLCLEHRAMKILLKEDYKPWLAAAVKLCNAPKARQEIAQQFREVHEALQSGQFEAELIQKVIEALSKTRL